MLKRILNMVESLNYYFRYKYLTLVLLCLISLNLKAQHFPLYKNSGVKEVPTLTSTHLGYSNAANVSVLNVYANDGDVLVLHVSAKANTNFADPSGWTRMGG